MNIKKSIFILSAIFCLSLYRCGAAEAEAEEEETEENVIDLAEQRRLELIEKGETDSLTLEEWSELDSLEVEKYKKELMQSVLQKVEEEGD